MLADGMSAAAKMNLKKKRGNGRRHVRTGSSREKFTLSSCALQCVWQISRKCDPLLCEDRFLDKMESDNARSRTVPLRPVCVRVV